MQPLIQKEDTPTLALALITVMIALLLVAVIARGAASPVGDWQCSGTQPGGQSYQVNLAVKPEGHHYSLVWSAPGGIVAFGFGVLHEDRLSAGYVTQSGPGIVVYIVSPGRLDGTWAAGDGAIYAEQCRLGDPV